MSNLVRARAELTHRLFASTNKPTAVEKEGEGVLFVRHWGNWEMPADATQQDIEDGDYDWEVLSEESHDQLIGLVQAVGQSFGVKVDFSVEEKNWIRFEVTVGAPAKKAPAAPKKAAAPKAAKSVATQTGNITSIVDNPKKPGSATLERFKAYKVGMTREEALAAGLTTADLSYDTAKGFIVWG